MLNVQSAVKVVIALAVVGIVAAFLTPVAINALENPTSDTITQNTTEKVEVNPELNATLDSIGTSGTTDNATYSLTSGGQTITKTVDNGTNATYSFNRGDVVLTVDNVDGVNSEATSTFEYPKEFAYSDGARSMWGLLGLAIVLAVFILVLGRGMSAMK